MSTCDRAESIRDYAFDELAASERAAVERHLAECHSCAADLDQLRLTTAALRVLPDVEPPQRIAFVSDKVFTPSKFWNFAPWLGFASTAVMAIALVITVYNRPVEIRTVVSKVIPTPSVEEVVNKAVAQAQIEDARVFRAELARYEQKHEQERRSYMDAIYVAQAHANRDLLESGGSGQ